MNKALLILGLMATMLVACAPKRGEPDYNRPVSREAPSTPQEDVWEACALAIHDRTGLNYIIEGWEYTPAQVTLVETGQYEVTIEDRAVGHTYRKSVV